jgi:hypothetical protein
MPEMKLKMEIEGLADAEQRVAALHTQWSEIVAMARDHKDAAVLCASVAKLELTANDTLVLTTPQRITMEQRGHMVTAVRAGLGVDVHIMVLDGGMTMSQVSAVASDGRTA